MTSNPWGDTLPSFDKRALAEAAISASAWLLNVGYNSFALRATAAESVWTRRAARATARTNRLASAELASTHFCRPITTNDGYCSVRQSVTILNLPERR